jgi:hypothetical protein
MFDSEFGGSASVDTGHGGQDHGQGVFIYL